MIYRAAVQEGRDDLGSTGYQPTAAAPPPTCGTLESGDRLGSALAALGDFAASAATSLPGVCLLDVRRDRAPAQPSVTRGA